MNDRIAAIPDAVFSPTDRQLDDAQRRACPLHVGDTWLASFAGARMQDLREADWDGLHRYSEPQGIPDLVDAIVEKVRTRNALACDRTSVWVAAGATGALGAAVGAIAEKPELLGRVLILVGLAEGIAIYGLIIAILILNRLG